MDRFILGMFTGVVALIAPLVVASLVFSSAEKASDPNETTSEETEAAQTNTATRDATAAPDQDASPQPQVANTAAEPTDGTWTLEIQELGFEIDLPNGVDLVVGQDYAAPEGFRSDPRRAQLLGGIVFTLMHPEGTKDKIPLRLIVNHTKGPPVDVVIALNAWTAEPSTTFPGDEVIEPPRRTRVGDFDAGVVVMRRQLENNGQVVPTLLTSRVIQLADAMLFIASSHPESGSEDPEIVAALTSLRRIQAN